MADVSELEPAELKRRLDRGDALTVLDVREHEELHIAAFPVPCTFRWARSPRG